MNAGPAGDETKRDLHLLAAADPGNSGAKHASPKRPCIGNPTVALLTPISHELPECRPQAPFSMD